MVSTAAVVTYKIVIFVLASSVILGLGCGCFPNGGKGLRDGVDGADEFSSFSEAHSGELATEL